MYEGVYVIGLAVLVLCTAAAVDFAHAQYAQAMYEHRQTDDWRLGLRLLLPRYWRCPIHVAGRWSVLQWSAASVGFVVAVRISVWYLPFEGIGLLLGTLLGGTRAPGSEVVTGMAIHHVEDSESVQGSGAAKTLAHSIYRCGVCRALQVTGRGEPAPTKCGKCRT